MNTTETAPPASSFIIGRVLANGLLGAAVALLCLVPPGVHFLTGPLGPFLGGMVGGSRLHAKFGMALVIGLTMGSLLAVAVGAAALWVLPVLTEEPTPMTTVQFVSAGVFLYASILGTAGAATGGRKD